MGDVLLVLSQIWELTTVPPRSSQAGKICWEGDTIYAGETEFMHFVKCCLSKHNEYDETLLQYLPKSNPRHQRPSLKAENGRDIRDQIWFSYFGTTHSFFSDSDSIFQLDPSLYFALRSLIFERDEVWIICNSGQKWHPPDFSKLETLLWSKSKGPMELQFSWWAYGIGINEL